VTTDLARLLSLPALLRHRRADRAAIVAFQERQLRRLVSHAAARVHVYRQRYRAHGVRPADVRSIADLAALPIVAKGELQALPIAERVAEGVDAAHLLARRTSGSTGQPFEIRRTRVEALCLDLLWRRATRELGILRRDRVAAVQLVRGHGLCSDRFPRRALRRFGLYRHARISCLLEPAAIVAELRRVAPDVITGFPSVLAHLADELGAEGLHGIRPRLIDVGGELLTEPMRERIAAVFQATVVQHYASHELQMIAWQCRATGDLHVCDDGVIVEVLDGDCPVPPGGTGELVATALHSFAMPFIRFRLGDLVTRGAEACPCGSPFSTLRVVQGRVLDYFRLPGRSLHPYHVISTIRDGWDWIARFQLVQDRIDAIAVRVVPRVTPSPGSLERLREAVLARIGAGVAVRVDLVREIGRDAGGKFRVSHSLVGPEPDAGPAAGT
jgi:phenylacetate-CoA ligase